MLNLWWKMVVFILTRWYCRETEECVVTEHVGTIYDSLKSHTVHSQITTTDCQHLSVCDSTRIH